jgi:N-acetylmuramoyl-L-alanine amidase
MRAGAAVAGLLLLGALAAACGSSGSSDAGPSSTSRSTTTTRAIVPPPTMPPTTAAPTTTSVTAAPAPTTTTAPRAVPTGDLGAVAGRIVVIDAGHNGGNASHTAEISRLVFIGTQTRACDTTGTQTASGYPEHAYTLDVAQRLASILAGAGAQIVMTRTDDTGWGPCIDERAAIGNRAHAAVGISIHADGGPTGGRGFHVNMPANIPGYTDDIYANSHTLGIVLRDAYASVSGMPPANYIGSGGLIERSDFGGLNLSDVPKVLFETGNMQNPTDAALLQDPAFRARAAAGLASGIAAYLAAH